MSSSAPVSLIIGASLSLMLSLVPWNEHASIPATVTRKYGFDEMNTRAAAANDVSVCINPDYLDDPQPPIDLPKITIDFDEAMASAGQTTSQHELFDALGIEVPLRGAKLEKARAIMKKRLERAERLGVVRLR